METSLTSGEVGGGLRQCVAQQENGDAGVLDARLDGDGHRVGVRPLKEACEPVPEHVAHPRDAYSRHNDLEGSVNYYQQLS